MNINPNVQNLFVPCYNFHVVSPLFSMLWLDTNSYQEGIYKLSFGTNPGPDVGEDIDEAEDNEPIKLRKAA